MTASLQGQVRPRWLSGDGVPVDVSQGAANSMSLGLLGLLRTRSVWSYCFVAAVLVDAYI